MFAATISAPAGAAEGAITELTLLPAPGLDELDPGKATLQWDVHLVAGDGMTAIGTGVIAVPWTDDVRLDLPHRLLVADRDVDVLAILWARPTSGEPWQIVSVANEIRPWGDVPDDLTLQFTPIVGTDADGSGGEDDAIPPPSIGAPDSASPHVLTPDAAAPSNTSGEAIGVRNNPPDPEHLVSATAGIDPYEAYSNPVYQYVGMRNCDVYDIFYTALNCQVWYRGPGNFQPAGEDPPERPGEYMVATRDIPWVTSLRGYSTRIWGAESTFSFTSSYSQRWGIGTRLRAGPFEYGGSKSSQTGSTSADTWPKRKDCIGKPESCSNDTRTRMGTLWETGRNTWTWERWLLRGCDYTGQCFDDYMERTYVSSVDGGTEWQTWNDGTAKVFTTNYLRNPTDVRAGKLGSGAEYARGATSKRITRQEGSESTFGPGAVLTAGNSAWGMGEWAPSYTEENVQSMGNHYTFRDDEPYFGKWLRYDLNKENREYWTCEWAPGWTGSGCWSAP